MAVLSSIQKKRWPSSRPSKKKGGRPLVHPKKKWPFSRPSKKKVAVLSPSKKKFLSSMPKKKVAVLSSIQKKKWPSSRPSKKKWPSSRPSKKKVGFATALPTLPLPPTKIDSNGRWNRKVIWDVVITFLSFWRLNNFFEKNLV